MGTANSKGTKRIRKGKSNTCKHEECKAFKMQNTLEMETLEKKKLYKPSYIEELIKKQNFADSMQSISYKQDFCNSDEELGLLPLPPSPNTKPNNDVIVFQAQVSVDDLILRDILPEIPNQELMTESVTTNCNEKSKEIHKIPSTAVEFSGSKRSPPESNKSSLTTIEAKEQTVKKKNDEIYEQMEALGLGFLRDGEWIPTDVISRTIWKKVETENAGVEAKWKRQSKSFPVNVYK